MHENPARPFHLDTLLDEHAFVGLSHAVGHHPRGGAASCGSGGRVLPVVEKHPRVRLRDRAEPRTWDPPGSSPRTQVVLKSLKRTGTGPTLRSSLISRAPLAPRKTKAVPSVGCPAKGNSSSIVKMRTRTPRWHSMVVRGRMKVVSERFVSLANACICASVRPRPSRTTASAFPSSGVALKTSI